MSNASTTSPSIQMLSCHDKVVQVILFHDQTDSSREEQLRRFLQQALSQFAFYFADDVIQGHGTSLLPIQPSDPSSSLNGSSKDIEASCAVTASLSVSLDIERYCILTIDLATIIRTHRHATCDNGMLPFVM